MDLFLIRHGESEGNAHGSMVGGGDPPLTERGRRQARLAGQRLASEGIETLYCGPLLRNLETAVLIMEESDLVPVLLPAMFELGAAAAAWTPQEIGRRFPHVRTGLVCDGTYEATEDETREHAHARVSKHILSWFREKYAASAARIAVVSHGTLNDVFLSCCLGLPPCEQTRFSSGNGSFHWIEMTPEHTKMRKLNDESHLPEHERS